MLPILPILVPLTAIVVLLFLYRWHLARLIAAMSFISASFLLSLFTFWQVFQSGDPLIFQLGGWSFPSGITIVVDLLSGFMLVLVQFIMLTGIIYAAGSQDTVVRYPLFYPLFFGMVTGLSGAVLTGDIFNFFVFAELLVISAAVLTAISDDQLGVEAAYKYFYISLLASIALLLAVGTLYIAYGTLNMADLSRFIAASQSPLLPAALSLLMVTFMVKGAVFPFHFWQPDFHTTAPTPVSAMLSSVVVKLGVYGILRLSTLFSVSQNGSLSVLLISVGMIGIVLGGLSAIGTNNLKRMLAYSTLAQVGFILVAIGWGTPLAISAALVFTFNHSLIKAAMLMLAGVAASRAPVKSAAFDNLAGIGNNIPVTGILFLAGGLALAGIPPFNGFISKLLLFQSGFAAEKYGSLLIVGIASILSLIYVMRAYQKVWWQPFPEGKKVKPVGDQIVAPGILILASLLLGIWADPLIRVTQFIAQAIIDNQVYIQAVVAGGG